MLSLHHPECSGRHHPEYTASLASWAWTCWEPAVHEIGRHSEAGDDVPVAARRVISSPPRFRVLCGKARFPMSALLRRAGRHGDSRQKEGGAIAPSRPRDAHQIHTPPGNLGYRLRTPEEMRGGLSPGGHARQPSRGAAEQANEASGPG
jgi:hypothetical protein